MAEPLALIIDDEKNLINSLSYGLERCGIRAEGALDGASGLDRIEELDPDLVLLDLRLPGLSGLEVLTRIRARRPGLPVIMISAHGDTRAAVEAVKAGAEDYFTKPFDLEDLARLIHTTVARQRLVQEISHHRREKHAEYGEFIGQSAPIVALREQIEVVGRSSARTVLVLGESGTGKALVARALHRASSRAAGAFVEVNCATLPENLLEAELFGAERGAYTGALQRRAGLAELADGGTLFLDEIGELPTGLQAKLLGFLDNHHFRPVGSARERSADVRVIAATNRDIELEVREGRMRPDLYYRLNLMRLVTPRLAARGRDAMLLAEHFAARFAVAESCAPIHLQEEARELLLDYPWPGNVRELKNLIERLTILHPGQAIGIEHLPPELCQHTGGREGDIGSVLARTEREVLLQALAESGGHRSRAAEALGISRHALKRRLQRLGIP